MDIGTFKTHATLLPAHIAILMRGPTGIGKSHLGKAAADALSLPFVDVRGSTMSEGDVGGYPDLEGMKETGVMTFCMPSWFMRACKEPVVLMLDELNRSLPGVQQSFFQLVLDRELGNDKNGVPYRLHPETRIIAAVNHGSEYDVNDMDPALLRRFWVVDLEPTSDDWVSWAEENGIDSVMIDFIRQEPEHLRVDPKDAEPGKVLPTPASWHRLDDTLKHAGMAPSEIAGTDATSVYILAAGFVGVEAAAAFKDFVSRYELVISAEDVLDRWDDVKDRVAELGNDRINNVIDKLGAHCKDNTWKAKQVKHVAAFAEMMSDEMMISLWNKVSGSHNLPNVQKLHKLMGKKVVAAVQASRNLG